MPITPKVNNIAPEKKDTVTKIPEDPGTAKLFIFRYKL